ncbi:MAG: hypothetical protein GY925_06705 [Actinomycetia bacterium]|nr:hypothetical protein [Actinomycetes bacterium]
MKAMLVHLFGRMARAKAVSAGSPHARWIAAVASLFVLVGSILSARALDLAWGDLRTTPLALAAVSGVALIPLNAAEYRLTSRLSGIDVGLASSVHTTILASAVNSLPIPAGAAVRIQGLREAGNSTRRAAASTGSVALLWLGISGLAAGASLLVLGDPGTALLFGGAGLVFTPAAGLLIKGLESGSALLGRAVVVELLFVALATLRFLLVVKGVGIDIEVAQAVVIAGSSALASAVGVIPGVFGLFEGIAAGLAVVVGLPASAGFLATAILRLLSAATFGLAALTLTVRKPTGGQSTGSAT